MSTLFYILFFATPFVLWPYTSELFEFNKMIFVYTITVLIMTVWLSRCLAVKKFIFRRTLLDIPLLLFFGSQILSTVFSIDPRTSLLGYYSRFNGGLLSVICYTLLYWAFVSNMNRKNTLYVIRYTLYAAMLVSTYGIAQRFGIDKNLWVQDVVNRVFSTLGQPNWLAAYLVALLPISNYQFLISNQNSNSKFLNFKSFLWFGISILLFTTLLFTKSRSGLLGFVFADLIFWGYVLFKYKKQFLVQTVVLNSLFIVLALFIGSPLTINHQPLVISNAPALEVGGTESGTIRKIVWKGALQVWLHYPLFGSGVETFAFSYYKFRPVEHNLVSEWDFIYNKAHNEYLNLAATTGAVGLVSYLALIAFSVYLLWKSKNFALLAGYVSILVSNFFGFSIIVTQLQLFLFPAFAVTLGQESEKVKKYKRTTFFFYLLALLPLYFIFRYWYADILYAKGDTASLERAVKISPRQAIFHNRLALNYADEKNAPAAVTESNLAMTLSPANLNILRNRASMFIKLSALDLKYLGSAKEALLLAMSKAPTDARIFYTLALVYLRTGESQAAVDTLQKTIQIKPNYKDARYWWALILIENGRHGEAKEQLTYILEKIDPNDQNSKKQLEKLK